MLAALCAGIQPTARLSLFASLASEVEQVRSSRELPGLADFDHDLRQSARRQRGSRPGTLKLPTGGRLLYVAGAPSALWDGPLPSVWYLGWRWGCLHSPDEICSICMTPGWNVLCAKSNLYARWSLCQMPFTRQCLPAACMCCLQPSHVAETCTSPAAHKADTNLHWDHPLLH